MAHEITPFARRHRVAEARARVKLHPQPALAHRAMATKPDAEQVHAATTDCEEPTCRAQAIMNERARRSEYFPAELFGEPAWDILLELYAAQAAQPRQTSPQIAKEATFPTTTTLRWLKALDAVGFVDRQPDPLDGRRVFLSLTPKAQFAMRSYLFPGEGEISRSPKRKLGLDAQPKPVA